MLKTLLFLALAAPAQAADAEGMLADYAAALEKRAALDGEILRRSQLFTEAFSRLEAELDSDAAAAKVQCAQAEAGALKLRETAAALEETGAALARGLAAIPQGACDAYDLRRGEPVLGRAAPLAAQIEPLASEAKSIARNWERLRAEAQAIAAPWDQRSGRGALLTDQALSLRALFEEARQRLKAAAVTRAEIHRLSGGALHPSPPSADIDYAARERGVIDAPFARLTKKIRGLYCAPAETPGVAAIDAAARAARASADSLRARGARCGEEAAAALASEIADAPRVQNAVSAEERAYEEERKKHLARDLEQWRRLRKREARRLAQQRRFAQTMRPPRPRPAADGRKGPFLAWGAQSVPDAPLRLRISDVDAFEADGAAYKRVLRPRAFRSAEAARQWVCERLAGLRERPVIGRSAEFGSEIVAVGDEIRCD